MLGKRLVVRSGIVALAILLSSSPAPAEELLDLSFKPDGTYAPFPSKPARELMSPVEYASYTTHLENLECDKAETILNTVFIRNYPQHSAARKTDERHNLNHSQWLKYASSQFMDYGLCNTLFYLGEAEDKLTSRSVPLRKYTPRKLQKKLEDRVRHKHNSNQFYLDSRERLLGILLAKANLDFVPAILEVARLVRRGNVFSVGADVEYYLIARINHLGHSNNKLKDRQVKLSGSLADSRRQHIEQEARSELSLVVPIFDDDKPL